MIRLNRLVLSGMDWILIGAVFVLTVVGVLTIFSATRPLPGSERPDFFLRQIYWGLLGAIVLAGASGLDYAVLQRRSRWLFGISVLLLLVVLFKGRTGMGAQRWIGIGPIGFQPSELFKIAFVIAYARYLSSFPRSLVLRDVLVGFVLYLAVPFVLILRQPDLGTAIVVLTLFVLLTLTKGMARRVLVLVVAVSLVSVPFVGTMFWDGLKDYQKKRIIAFLDPDVDPEGTSYHVTQSKVAIGSGGLVGKGYMQGTQGAFRFLPEKHTDFVFAVFAEEWGFVGSSVLLIVYLIVILRGIAAAVLAKDDFGRYLAMGLTYMLATYVFINVGMTLGLVPVVGIPLPFMSYGGTAMLTNMLTIGLIESVRTHRFHLFG
jgi:rod shape determining protein RodA